jgi:hypothetical protein
MGTSTMVTPTSHCGRRSRASFRINGREIRFPSQLSEDQKSKVSVSTPRYLYHRVKPKRPFKTHDWDNVLHARCFDFFAIQAVQWPTRCECGLSPHVSNMNPIGMARW